MRNTDEDRVLAIIENLHKHIYQCLLPHSHSIRRDISRLHFPDPEFLLLLAQSLAIAFIVAPWSALWGQVWQRLLKTGDTTPAIILQIRQEVESTPQRGQPITKNDVLEAMRSSLRTYSTLPADTIEMVAEDVVHYIMQLYQVPKNERK